MKQRQKGQPDILPGFLKPFIKMYDGLVDLSMKAFGFCAGPTVMLFFSSFFVAFFAYGYSRAYIRKTPAEMLTMLIFVLLLAMIFHSWMYDFFRKIGIPGPLRNIKRINSYYNGSKLKPDLNTSDYRRLLRDISRFPLNMMLTALPDVTVVLLSMIAYDYFWQAGTMAGRFTLIAIIALPIHAQFCFVTSDLHLMKYRAQLTEILYEKEQFHPVYWTLSLKIKFLMIVLSIILSWYILMTLVSSAEASTVEGWRFILSFSIFSFFLFISLAVMYFSSIFMAVSNLHFAAINLRNGEKPRFFTSTSDKELMYLSAGFFEASRKVNIYKDNLEQQVQQRTIELENVNAQLLDKEKSFTQELEFAADIQNGMLPDTERPWDGISFGHFYRPMGKVSGDYFDIFRQQDSLYIIMADVSGHGIPAALITMAAKQAFNAAFEDALSPAEVLAQVNLDINSRVTTQDYLTAFVLKIDEKCQVTYANAAHHPMIHYKRKSEEIAEYDTMGYILGAMEEASESYENKKTMISSGDRFFLFSDGIVEQTNKNGEIFGKNRLIQMIHDGKNLTLKEWITKLEREIDIFCKGIQIRDDMTLLCIELTSKWAEFAKVFNKGINHFRAKEWKDALITLEEASELVPSYQITYLYLSKIYARLKAWQKSGASIEIYLKTHRKDSSALKLASSIYYNLDDLHQSQIYAKRLCEIDNSIENLEFMKKCQSKIKRL